MKIRQPIITVAGHVDHGKTSILDSLRGTEVQETEAGGITQKISFTKMEIDTIYKRCPELKTGGKLDFSGLLFIDTPGHAAFSNLRKRGGSLADLAILVIDINEGIKPQTKEVIDILKFNKTPFIIALNKIDNISGWRKQSEDLRENINMQSQNTKLSFDEKLFTIIGALHHHGFKAKPYYEVDDFKKQLALIPCSAKTGEGISELIMMFCGLSQKFLKEKLELGNVGKGVILEINKVKNMQYVEAILYDGTLSNKDKIAIASFDDPIVTKIRVLEEIIPLSNKFRTIQKTKAANGIRMQLNETDGVLPGMPFTIVENNLEEIKESFKKEVGEKIKTDDFGLIIKADSLGSLEALITLLKQKNINIIKAGIGKINKKDVISAKTNLREDPINGVILGFNTELDDEAKSMNSELKEIKVITDDVVYKIIENLLEYQDNKRNEIKREKMMGLAPIVKLKILHNYVFRNSNPAVFGVKVEAGKLKPGTKLISNTGEKIAKVKTVQENQKKLDHASMGQEVAISLPGITFDRQLKDLEVLYSDLSEGQFREYKKNKDLLTRDEIQTIQKIAELKRKENVTWGV